MLLINNNGNVNFQAKLSISQIASNEARWQNISKIFEKNTPEINDLHSISVKGSFSKGLDVNYGAMVYSLTANGSMLLKDLSDTKIAEKLIKILKLGKTPLDVFMDSTIPPEKRFGEMAKREKEILKRDTLLQKNLVSPYLFK